MSNVWRLRTLNLKSLAWSVWRQVQKDRVTAQAAQLSFYFLLSIFPLLIALTALLGLFIESASTLDDLLARYLERVAPESVLTLISDTLQEVRRGASGTKLSIGLLGTIWVASSGIAALINALNIAYDVPEGRRWWKRRLVAVALTVVFLTLMFIATLLLIYGPLFIDILASYFRFGTIFEFVWKCVEWVLVLVFVLLAFNILYIYAPNVEHHRWHWLMPGTVAGVLLWVLASLGFKLYLAYFDRYSVTYGSLGAVIIVLLWFYLTGIAVIVGGEINSEIARATNTKPRVKEALHHRSH